MNFFPSRKVSQLFFSPQLISVRWRRKPRWIPKAPKKMFRVAERPVVHEEETKELQLLFNHYRTSMKSINHFIKEDYHKSDPSLMSQKRSDDEIEKESEELNNAWNKQVALIREQRLNKKLVIEKEKIIDKLIAAELKEKQLLENVQEMIKKEKENSKNYITQENINIKIEEALENPVDITFAIDLQGNIFKGFGSKLEIIENKNTS